MRERSPGNWQLRVFEGTDPVSGKKRCRTRSCQGGKRAASNELTRFVAEIDGAAVAPTRKTVGALLDEWLAHIEHLGRSPSTLYNYRRLVEQLLEGFKSQQLAEVTPKLVDDLYRHLGTVGKRKPATVLRFHELLRAAFAQGVRWGLMDRNPTDRATSSRVNRPEMKPPAIDDVLRVIDRAAASRNPENALVLRLLAATGCRRGEVCGLQWQEIDFESEPMRVLIRRAVFEIEKKLIEMTREDEINWDLRARSHFVLLGAGASRAALPSGDKHGRSVPLLRKVADAMDLASAFPDDPKGLARDDFEAAYSELADRGGDTRTIDEKARSFLASLEIPDEANVYDALQLSLRRKDLIFAFNWDPLVVQSRRRLLQRGVSGDRLPRLHLLHGNTAVGTCDEHARMGLIGHSCEVCGEIFTPTRLLYPVKHKNYQDGSFIEAEWATANEALEPRPSSRCSDIALRSQTSRPSTYSKDAWGDVETDRAMNQVEIINRPGADHDARRATWDRFIHTHHYDNFERFEDSWIAQHPRRTMEAFVHQYLKSSSSRTIPFRQICQFPTSSSHGSVSCARQRIAIAPAPTP